MFAFCEQLLCASCEFRRDLVNGWMVDREGWPWRPCRFPIKQMPVGTRATPQAPASISSCSLGRYTWMNLLLSLSPSISPLRSKRVSSVARVVRHAKFELNSPRAHASQSRATFTYKSYIGLHLLHEKPKKRAYVRETAHFETSNFEYL